MQSKTEILDYLKTMKFKRSLFGVSRSDALEKIRTLNLMYQKQQAETEEQALSSAEYGKKMETLTKTFVNLQEQADGIIGQAKKQAEEIVGTAQKNAADITEQAKKNSERTIAQQKQEIGKLSEQKNALLLELKFVSDTLNSLVGQDFGGEISGNPK